MGFASCLLSLLLHISLILLAVFAPWTGTEMRMDLDQPVYEVDVVRLPEQKKTVNVPRSDTTDQEQTEQEKQPAKQAKAPPKEQPKAKAAPAPAQESEAVQIAQEDKKPQATQTPQKKEPQPQDSPQPQDREEVQTAEGVMQEALQDASEQAEKEAESDEDNLENVLAQLRQEAIDQGMDPENLGRTSSTQGAEGIYGAIIREKIRSNWRFPDMGRDDDLQTTVKITISDQGQITDHSVVRSSGDSQFDSSVLRAIDRTGNLQTPPSSELRTVQITFHLQEMSP